MKTGQGSYDVCSHQTRRAQTYLITLSARDSTLGGIHLKKIRKSEYRNPKQTHAKAEFEFPSTV
jgi:hypothetical protein